MLFVYIHRVQKRDVSLWSKLSQSLHETLLILRHTAESNPPSPTSSFTCSCLKSKNKSSLPLSPCSCPKTFLSLEIIPGTRKKKRIQTILCGGGTKLEPCVASFKASCCSEHHHLPSTHRPDLEMFCCVFLFVQTSEEVTEKMTGLQVPMERDNRFTMPLGESVSRLPKFLDYRKKGMVTSVKNQVRHPLVPVHSHAAKTPQSGSISVFVSSSQEL